MVTSHMFMENYIIDVDVDGINVELALWDTSGSEEYARLRPLSYPETHIFLFCFSLGVRETLKAVHERWMPEVNYFSPGVPGILVGCKKDLRDSTGKGPKSFENCFDSWKDGRCVTVEECEEVAKMIGAVAYLECSAFTGEGVTELFNTAARKASQVQLPPKKRFKLGCIVV